MLKKIETFFLVSDEGICPPEFKYVYDGGRKCCQFPYEDDEELNFLEFNSRQCQNNATKDCPFDQGCDDCKCTLSKWEQYKCNVILFWIMDVV